RGRPSPTTAAVLRGVDSLESLRGSHNKGPSVTAILRSANGNAEDLRWSAASPAPVTAGRLRTSAYWVGCEGKPTIMIEQIMVNGMKPGWEMNSERMLSPASVDSPAGLWATPRT